MCDCRREPVPRQQLVEPAGGVIGNAAQHVGEPGLRIDIVELGGLCRIPNYADAPCAHPIRPQV